MFSIFKMKMHEPVQAQRKELLNHPLGPMALAGEDCDEVAGAVGPLGHSYKNPIPVNGQLGTYKYLTKLTREATGRDLLFHRLGSTTNDRASGIPVDIYEVVDVNGRGWDILFLDMYHPRRSNKAPMGYRLKPYNRKTGDHVFGLGVDVFCPNFPFDLADAVESHNGFDSVALLIRKIVALDVTAFIRPPKHKEKVDLTSLLLEGKRKWQVFEEFGGP